MDGAQWTRVRTLLESAMELPEPRREALLAHREREEPEVVAEVRELLAADPGETSTFLEPPPEESLGSLLDDPQPVQPGTRVGAYEVVELIASGGMGSVYLGRRADDQFEKRVAIKVIKRGMDTDEILGRFRRERQVLADLEHPGIARLIDGGAMGDGRPFLVMEFVEGRDLLESCADRTLETKERVELFREVCAAVAHAHRRHVVHRDLKPGNILVTDAGRPKLLDFGIAKVLAGDAEPTQLTEEATRPMTLEYASPEQVRGDRITPASDVYSLGVVLYRLLTGEGPYGRKTTAARDLERAICELDPSRPSLRATDRRLTGDLDNIVLKALRKEPERRYSDAGELGEDLGRYLAGKPVLARPATALYRYAKFARRHPVPVGSLGVILVLVAVGSYRVFGLEHDLSQAQASTEVRGREMHDFARIVLQEVNRDLNRIAGSLETRELLLGQAVDRLDSLGESGPLDPRIQYDRAMAYISVGLIQGGYGLANLGKFEEARASFARALALAEDLVETKPGWGPALAALAEAHMRLAENELLTGSLERAEERMQAAFEALDRVEVENAEDERSLVTARFILHSRRATLAGEAHDLASAVEHRERALELAEQRVLLAPDDVDAQREFAGEVGLLAGLRFLERRVEEAEEGQREAAAMLEELAREYPRNDQIRRDLAKVRSALGDFLLRTGRVAEAIEQQALSLEAILRLAEAAPENREVWRDLSLAHMRLGNLHAAREDLEAALEQYAEMRVVNEAILAEQPGNKRARRELGIALVTATGINGRLGRYEEALELGHAGHAILEELAAENPSSAEPRRDLVSASNELGSLELALGRREELPAAERRAHLERAEGWFQGALDELIDQRERGLLIPADEQYVPLLEGHLRRVRAAVVELGDGA